MKILNHAQANAIYDILVAECEAIEDNRTMFVIYVMNRYHEHEFRFQGNLGFGGKLYNNVAGLYIGCYREDRTPDREALINKVNEKLSGLAKRWNL